MLKTLAITVAALSLAACYGQPTDHEGVETKSGHLQGMTAVADARNHGLYKVCDGTRLVYVSYAFQKPGGVAVVENARECQ